LQNEKQEYFKMKLLVALFLCLTVAFTVYGQRVVKNWTGLKCGIDSQKLYDRSFKLDTCNDYCISDYAGNADSGQCVYNSDGYGECKCKFQPMIGK